MTCLDLSGFASPPGTESTRRKWLRNGTDKGYARLIIEDDEGAMFPAGSRITLERSVWRAKHSREIKSTLEVTGPDDIAIPAPQTFVAKFADSLAINPASFLNLKAKEAAEELLKVLPIWFSAADVSEAIQREISTPSDLKQLSAVRQELYEKGFFEALASAYPM